MLSLIKDNIIHIDQEEILAKARSHGLNIRSVSDFRKLGYKYQSIEHLMDDYRQTFTQISTLGGLTAGMGSSYTSSAAFAGIDMVIWAIQLYRLSQRFAILNGFSNRDPLHKNKILSIYIESLGVNAAAKAALKYHYLQAGTLADNGKASEALMLKIIIKAAKYMGKEVSSKEAGRLIPIIGGVEGAILNYSIARKAGKSLQKAYKRAYFKTWQGEEV